MILSIICPERVKLANHLPPLPPKAPPRQEVDVSTAFFLGFVQASVWGEDLTCYSDQTFRWSPCVEKNSPFLKLLVLVAVPGYAANPVSQPPSSTFAACGTHSPKLKASRDPREARAVTMASERHGSCRRKLFDHFVGRRVARLEGAIEGIAQSKSMACAEQAAPLALVSVWPWSVVFPANASS